VSTTDPKPGTTLEVALVRFDGEGTAVQRFADARDAIPRTSAAQPRWIRDVGFIERHHNGRLLLRGTFAGHYVDVDESDTFSQKGAGEGAVAGGLLGVLVGPPGIAVGLVLGAVVGARRALPDEEVEPEPEAVTARIREMVPPSSSAIVMIAAPPEVDELLDAIGDRAADTLRRVLAEDEIAEIGAALSTAPRTDGETE
jgi:uncharacterized membrane protein